MKTDFLRNSGARRGAFTLIEIMVVLAVVAIIATMAVPAMNSVLKGSKMTQASDEFERDLSRAQGAAMRENHPIEFRFYKYSDPEQPNSKPEYRAYQAVKRVLDPANHRDTLDIIPIFDARPLPPGIIFDSNIRRSTILKIKDIRENVATDYGDKYDDSIPRVDSAEYKAFYFRPDGSSNLVSIDAREKWCVTLRPEASPSGGLPPDFVTFQVDGYNGQVRRYEKGL